MKAKLTRRDWVRGGMMAAVVVPAGLWAGSGALAQSVQLDPNDATAKALGYVKTSVVAGQKCGNCALYQGKDGEAQAGCAIFAGKTVVADGWCKSWSKKA